MASPVELLSSSALAVLWGGRGGLLHGYGSAVCHELRPGMGMVGGKPWAGLWLKDFVNLLCI